MPGLPAEAVIYIDEIPRRPRPLPRFVDEFVMAQLENPDNLARLPDPTTRHLLIMIIETGLRAFDACALPFSPVIDDSVGWPCLRYFNHKMAAEQMIPLSAAAAQAIRDQQTHLRERFDVPPPVLFPADNANPDGTRSISYGTLRDRLSRWERDIGLHDEAGQPIVVTAHQFRHTLGTRMINQGVPQHIVQKMLGHASPQMTARYATIHDSTVRAAFDDYQRRRVDIHGLRLEFDPDAPAADAEWVKHNLARVAASLPNGYCGRPPQQDCPHPNACLTCPDFQTTPQFLPLHRRQHDDTLVLLPPPSTPATPDSSPTTVRSPTTSARSSTPSNSSTRRPPMTAEPPPALTAATHHRGETTRARARQALRRLDRDGHPITFAAVADVADVSRSLLYRDPDLRAEIEALRGASSAGVNRPPFAQRSSDASLHQRLAAALDDNRALRAEVQLLRDQLANTLGEQRAATVPSPPRGRTIGPCS